MVNRMGPEVRGVTTRPGSITPTATDTWFQDCTGSDPTTGTAIEQTWLNSVIANLRALFTAAGNPTVNDNLLVNSTALQTQGGQMSYASMTGTANALVLTLSPAPLLGLQVGMEVTGLITTTNTSAAALVLNALASKPIVRNDLTPVQAGDLIATRAMRFKYDGTSWVCSTFVQSQFGAVNRSAYFFTNGTFQVPAGINSVEVEVIGAGGGGGSSSGQNTGGVALGNCGGGGGGGGYSRKRCLNLTPLASIAVVVGVGGAGGPGGAGFALNGTPGTAGTNGGSSSFAASSGTVTANGGVGGAYGTATLSAVGVGGAASGGDLNLTGGSGGFTAPNDLTTPTVAYASYILDVFNKGGNSGGGLSVVGFSGTGAAGIGFGTGGTGASGAGSGGGAGPGGAGANGLVIVRW